MEHSVDGPTATETTSSGKLQRHDDSQRQRKRQKFVSTESETCIRVQTREPELTSTFNAYTHGHSSSHTRFEDRRCMQPWSFKNHSQRKWTHSTRDVSNYDDRVVIVSYNILSVENSKNHPDLYRGVSPEHLNWDKRKKLLCKEVKDYQASILCFQEVDRFDDLNEILGNDGYRGLYKVRGGDSHDGCAIFWKDKLFTLLHEENIEFERFGLHNNIAQLCVLKMNEDLASADDTARSPCATTSRRLVVGNTHIIYNPKRGDIKLGQIRMFLEKAHELSQEWGKIPVVITGDLNSLPQSAMYQFLTSSELNIAEHNRRHLSGQELQSWRYNVIRKWTDEEKMLATGSELSSNASHPLKLCSAYAEIPGRSEVRDEIGEPLATSYHSKFSGTVDYIWHTLDLVPVKVLETLPMRSLWQTGGLPSEKWGSDHLAVVCELAFVAEGD